MPGAGAAGAAEGVATFSVVIAGGGVVSTGVAVGVVAVAAATSSAVTVGLKIEAVTLVGLSATPMFAVSST